MEKVKNSAPGTYDLVLMDIQMPVMNGFLSKPIVIEELVGILQENLD